MRTLLFSLLSGMRERPGQREEVVFSDFLIFIHSCWFTIFA